MGGCVRIYSAVFAYFMAMLFLIVGGVLFTGVAILAITDWQHTFAVRNLPFTLALAFGSWFALRIGTHFLRGFWSLLLGRMPQD